MKKILIAGAGRSSIYLIDFLAHKAAENNWQVTVCDSSIENATEKIKGLSNCRALSPDFTENETRSSLIKEHDVVVSMLPPALHMLLAKDCLEFGKHLCTASYVSPEMAELDQQAKEKNLVFLNEMGLDPGIDHMSAMAIIHKLKNEGCTVTGFESYCGGLVTPESEVGNPWKYRFTWNPMNVILAGQGTPVRFLWKGSEKLIPYHRLFETAKDFEVEGAGQLEAYANRDSLKYKELYELEHADTLLRGTLRRAPFCKGWSILVKQGLTDNTTAMAVKGKTVKQWMQGFSLNDINNAKEWLQLDHGIKNNTELEDMMNFLPLFADEKLPMEKATPAQVLLYLTEKVWKIEPTHHDRVVMLHRFHYTQNNQPYLLDSWMHTDGESDKKTAMAKTVGLPLAMGVELLLNNQISQRGVLIPTHPEIYEPVLSQLKDHGISFEEKITAL